MKKILFICTGNTCRSPMAQALFIKQIKNSDKVKLEDFQVLSAGIYTEDGLDVSSQAVAAMGEEGIDISLYKSSQLNEDLIKDTDYIFVMTRNHYTYLCDVFPDKRNKIHVLGEFAGEVQTEVLDPYGQGIEVYRQSLQQLKKLINKTIQKIIELEV